MPLVVRGRSMAEKTKEQLQIEAEKAKQKADAGEAALKEAKDESSKTRNPETGKKKVRLRVRSTTGYPQYYRAGLCFKKVNTEYEVPEDVAKILKADCWLVVEEVK